MSGPCLNATRTWQDVGNIVTSYSDWPTNKNANGWVKDAFKDGVADKVFLKKGTVLYKFNDFMTLYDAKYLDSQGLKNHQATMVSPWWSPYERFFHVWSAESGYRGGTDDPGWEAKKRMAKHFGVSIREWGRNTSAVKENWNSLKYLLTIKLNIDAYGFFGSFAQMARQDKNSTSKRFGNEGAQKMQFKYTSQGMKDRTAKYGSSGSLAGGGTQFYIPNIRVLNVANWSVQDLSHM